MGVTLRFDALADEILRTSAGSVRVRLTAWEDRHWLVQLAGAGSEATAVATKAMADLVGVDVVRSWTPTTGDLGYCRMFELLTDLAPAALVKALRAALAGGA